MLYKVIKKPDDLTSIVAAMFTGAGSVSAIVGSQWGHFRRTGLFTGVFVVESADRVKGKMGYNIIPLRPSTHRDMQFIMDLHGAPWRLWHNCFSTLGELWKTPS